MLNGIGGLASNPAVLVVDDERLVRWSLAKELSARGFQPRLAADAREARAQLLGSRAVVLDYALPDADGFELLEEMRQTEPAVPVLMLTGRGSIEHAVDAMRAGAWHYLPKPFDVGELCSLVAAAVALSEQEVPRVEDPALRALLGGSPRMAALRALVARVARSRTSTVLLQGETGTGKDLVARVLHRASARADGPFVHITCSALPATLLESELFGHEAGAFTGAERRRIGLLEQADGGTVFLDEIGELSLDLQAKLLRFLEDRRLRRVGGTEELAPDVRVVAATHVDLRRAVSSGRFREDLYYRLAVLSVDIPPLRERKADIPVLAHHFVRELVQGQRRLSAAALERLREHGWPGNVRELRNVLERATVLSDDEVIGPGDLALPVAATPFVGMALPAAGVDLEALDRDLLRQALERAGGNRTRAAALLGLTRDTVRYRIAKYGWDDPDDG